MPRKKAESTNDAVEVMRAALEGAKTALAKTPDMLPVLKEVGVVDSGGQGLVFIYEGFLSAFNHVRNDQCRAPQVSRWPCGN